MVSFGRAYELTYLADDGTSVVFSQGRDKAGLMIDFEITKTLTKESNTATIGITNASRDTIATLQKPGTVTFKAGYYDDIATILVASRDSFSYEDLGGTKRIELSLIEGQANFKSLQISKSYNIGATSTDIVDDLVQHLIDNVPSIESANNYSIADFNSYQSPQVVFGNAYDQLTNILLSLGYEFYVNKGVLTILPLEGATRDVEVGLSAYSGMIGSPKPIVESDTDQTSRAGVEVRSILNYNMDVGRRLKINSNDFDNDIFRIEAVTFIGNSFEGEWVCDIKAYEFNG